MRASLAFCTVSACVMVAAACSSSGDVASTFSANTGGAGVGGGAGAGAAGGIGGAIASSSTSSTTTSSQASSTSASSTSSSSASTTSSSSSSSSSSSGGPTCSYGYTNTCDQPEQLTQIDGDSGSDVDTVNGTTSQWFKVLVNDSVDPFSSAPESYTATLTSPPGMRFDLYAYEGMLGADSGANCDAAAIHFMGDPETITDMWPDSTGPDDSKWVLFEVRYISGTACGSAAQWTLTVAGNTQ